MALKFLEPDPKIAYINASLTSAEAAGEPDHEFYRKGERPALLVIDMQRGYVSPEPKPWVTGLPEGIAELIDGATAATGQLIEGRTSGGFCPCSTPGRGTCPTAATAGSAGRSSPIWRRTCARASPGWRSTSASLREAVRWSSGSRRPPGSSAPIWPRCWCSTRSTRASSRERRRAAACARRRWTRIAANFRTVVVEEAVCDKSLWAHKATLFDLWRYIATVASLGDVLDWMAEFGERNGAAGS